MCVRASGTKGLHVSFLTAGCVGARSAQAPPALETADTYDAVGVIDDAFGLGPAYRVSPSSHDRVAITAAATISAQAAPRVHAGSAKPSATRSAVEMISAA